MLGVSATAVRCEQVWSQAGRIHSEFRVKMSFRMLVQLTFPRENADTEYLEANLGVEDYRHARRQWQAIQRVRCHSRAVAALNFTQLEQSDICGVDAPAGDPLLPPGADDEEYAAGGAAQ